MNTAKEIILERIRSATKDVREEDQERLIPREYRQKGTLNPDENLRLFAERLRDYKAKVSIIQANQIQSRVTQACQDQKVMKMVIPPGLPQNWLPDGVEYLEDEPDQLTHQQLDESDGVLTGCSLAIAETGTIVLDGGKAQGRRSLTLLPDFHLCILWADQIVGIVPEAFARLEEKIKKSGPPVTFISGPSATSDIELNRVEGVHGPRRLEVFIIKDGG